MTRDDLVAAVLVGLVVVLFVGLPALLERWA